MPKQNFNKIKKLREEMSKEKSTKETPLSKHEEQQKEIDLNESANKVDLSEKQPFKENSDEITQRTAKSVLDQLEVEKNMPKAFDVRFIPREKIIRNKANHRFNQKKIESLAQSLLEDGLIHNLSAIYDMEEDIYTLESGERRYRALCLLIDKYKNYTDFDDPEYKLYVKNIKMFEGGFPVNVKKKVTYSRLEAVESEIRTYSANLVIREDETPAEKLAQINHLNSLIEERKQLTGEQGSNTKELAKELNISDRQVQKYQSINNLIPELKALFDAGNIQVNEGSTYSKLSEEEQLQIFELYKNNYNKDEIKKLVNEITETKKLVAEKEKLLTKALEEKNKAEEKISKFQKEMEEKIRLAEEKAKLDAKKNEDEKSEDYKLLMEKLVEKEKELLIQLEEKNKEIDSFQQQVDSLKNEVEKKEETTEKQTDQIDEIKRSLIKEDAEINKLLEICTKDVTSLVISFKQYDKKYNDELAEQLKLAKKESIMESILKLKKKLDSII
ncbi:MAG: ParB N-terminal domain-containing protein [Candidatus Galacturonibacter soehngenii]|nr:ParB N-terminal domain-containing protein [Candidatus Galacturonibacter soehngenii]